MSKQLMIPILIDSAEAILGAVTIQASDAGAGGVVIAAGDGGISLITTPTNGLVAITPEAAGEASPNDTVVIDSRVGVATFTGFTTAAAAEQAFTITNAYSTVGCGVFCTVSNTGVNDSQMCLTRVDTHTAGTMVVTTQNFGAAALNGACIISFWIIN